VKLICDPALLEGERAGKKKGSPQVAFRVEHYISDMDEETRTVSGRKSGGSQGERKNGEGTHSRGQRKEGGVQAQG